MFRLASETQARKPARRAIFFLLLLSLTAILAFVALLIPVLAPLSSPAVEVGQVASQDVLAPQPVTYESQVLTDQQREAAARSVSPVYTSPDTTIARQQLESLRTALAYITSVRADPYSTTDQKLVDLAALEHVQIDQDSAENILLLGDARWQAVQQEAIVVLEQVMRNTIREDRLEDVRRGIPSLVSLALPEEQADTVVSLVAAFVVPNSFYSEELTEIARGKARESVAAVSRSYVTGQTVVQRGQVITERDLEALQQLGLIQPELNWKDLASAATIVLLALAFFTFYLQRNRTLAQDLRGLSLIAVLFLTFLLGARLLIPGHTIVPYLLPMAAFGITVTVLFGPEPALVLSLPLAFLTAYGLPNDLDLLLYYALGSFFGVLALGRAHRVSSFFWAGMATAGSGAAVLIAYRLSQPTTDWVGLATLTGASFFNGLASASLSILLQFFLAQLLGMTTPLQLMEISRPDHPLLQMILRNSPGTYQHSLQVANLAEQAAERIGADPLLTRVGALYHDIGKALEPVFFIENQVPGTTNPHDEVDPHTSAQMILRHVSNGLELARKYKLPTRIQNFISEHHGTMITHYQYVRAVDAANGDREDVDMEKFRYPGPRPRSRETAILMLADGSEATVRAEHPKDEQELRAIIRGVIDNRIQIGQLDETDLTLRDLDAIVESFTTTLRGIYHPRIPYPKLEAASYSNGSLGETISPITTPAARSSEITVRSQTESSSSNT